MARRANGEIVEPMPSFFVLGDGLVEMSASSLGLQLGQQRLDRRTDVADEA